MVTPARSPRNIISSRTTTISWWPSHRRKPCFGMLLPIKMAELSHAAVGLIERGSDWWTHLPFCDGKATKTDSLRRRRQCESWLLQSCWRRAWVGTPSPTIPGSAAAIIATPPANGAAARGIASSCRKSAWWWPARATWSSKARLPALGRNSTRWCHSAKLSRRPTASSGAAGVRTVRAAVSSHRRLRRNSCRQGWCC